MCFLAVLFAIYHQLLPLIKRKTATAHYNYRLAVQGCPARLGHPNDKSLCNNKEVIIWLTKLAIVSKNTTSILLNNINFFLQVLLFCTRLNGPKEFDLFCSQTSCQRSNDFLTKQFKFAKVSADFVAHKHYDYNLN